jgi:hypothetical protein
MSQIRAGFGFSFSFDVDIRLVRQSAFGENTDWQTQAQKEKRTLHEQMLKQPISISNN